MTNSKLKQLLYILNDGQLHSGSELGRILGVTRSATWKLIHQLQQLEIPIAAKANQGYILTQPFEFLNTSQIKEFIPSKHQYYLEQAKIFDEIESTHNYMVEKIRHADKDLLLCLAERQTAGRGRSGRSWISPYGRNILLSMLWNTHNDYSELSGLSLVVAIALANALKRYGVPDIQLKWPNDILWQNRKLGGILIELHGESYAQCQIVLSFGLNLFLNSQEKFEYPVADIAEIIHKTPERNKLIGYCLTELLDTLAIFAEHGLSPFIEEWHSLDYCLNRPINIIAGQQIIKGIHRSITERGHIQIENEEGKLLTFSSAEVSLRFHP